MLYQTECWEIKCRKENISMWWKEYYLEWDGVLDMLGLVMNAFEKSWGST